MFIFIAFPLKIIIDSEQISRIIKIDLIISKTGKHLWTVPA